MRSRLDTLRAVVAMAIVASAWASARGADEGVAEPSDVPPADAAAADEAPPADPPPPAEPPAPDDEGPSPAAAEPPPAPPAADGTRSVVVPPAAPAEPTAAPATAPPAAPPVAAPPVAAPPGLLPTRSPAADPAPPAAAVAPPAVADPPAPVDDAAALLATALDPPADGGPAPAAGSLDEQLFARPLTLLEALERSGDRTRRLWIVQAYWKAAAAHATVRWSAAALERLTLVAPGSDPHDRAVLDVADAAARADLADARAQLGAAQQELADLARLPLGEPPPWPVDRPLTGPYQTWFDTIFATRVATGRVRAIARTLPARHDALAARAAAVNAAARASAMAEADHAKGSRPIEAVVAAHEALVAQERQFLQAVRSYNLDIAEYAMAVADLSVPDDRFVSMLIAAPVTWRPPAATPAAAPLPVSGPAGNPVGDPAPLVPASFP